MKKIVIPVLILILIASVIWWWYEDIGFIILAIAQSVVLLILRYYSKSLFVGGWKPRPHYEVPLVFRLHPTLMPIISIFFQVMFFGLIILAFFFTSHPWIFLIISVGGALYLLFSINEQSQTEI